MRRTRYKRKPLPFDDGEHLFFGVPLALYDTGFAAYLSGSELTRLVTLYRRASYHYSRPTFQERLSDLAGMDGVSCRTAERVHAKLEEYGLIRLNRRTRPHTITLLPPSEWPPCPRRAARGRPTEHRQTLTPIELDFARC